MVHRFSSHTTWVQLPLDQQKGPRENLAGLRAQLPWKSGRTLIEGVIEFNSVVAGLYFQKPDFNSFGSTLMEALNASGILR